MNFSLEQVDIAPTAIFWPSDDFENEVPIRGEKLLAVAELSDAASVCLRPRSELLRGFKPKLLCAVDVAKVALAKAIVVADPTDGPVEERAPIVPAITEACATEEPEAERSDELEEAVAVAGVVDVVVLVLSISSSKSSP